MTTTSTPEPPTMTMQELSVALTGLSPQRLTDAECRLALIWLVGYTRTYGDRGNWTHRAIAQAVKSQLDTRPAEVSK